MDNMLFVFVFILSGQGPLEGTHIYILCFKLLSFSFVDLQQFSFYD